MALSAPKKQNFEGDRVTIRVGSLDYSSEYIVPRSRIQTSEYLKEQLKACRRSSKTILEVNWTGPKVFGCYEHWLHSRVILSQTDLNNSSDGTYWSDETYWRWLYELIMCWCLGSKIQDHLYQDMVMSAIIDEFRKTDNGNQTVLVHALTSKNVVQFFNLTEAGSPMRILMADVVACFLPANNIQWLFDDTSYPREFIKGVTYRMALERDRLGSRVQVLEDQHDHFSGQTPSHGLSNAVVLRSSMRTDNQKKPEQVKFKTNGFAENECVFHMHRRRNKPCWR